MTKLKINEVFQSIQGEGRSSGQLANFIRFAGCSLQCIWCDTKYSWDWSMYDPKKEIQKMELVDLLAHLNVKEYRLTVLTGGEPLLYQTEIIELINVIWARNNQSMGRKFMKFEIETSGSLPLHFRLFELFSSPNPFVSLNISPKLTNSQNKKRWAVDEKFMEDIFVLGESNGWPMFKFVATKPKDFLEIGEFCTYYDIPRYAVWVMPEGMFMDQQLDKMKWVVHHCLANHYNFSPRLHTLIWDNERGV